jgi:hypothetical protein
LVQLATEVAVITNHDGEPVSFDWGGSHWLVMSVPVRWYARKTWWQNAAGAPRGVGGEFIETEMWRFRAASPSGSQAFEMRREGAVWQLNRVL